MTKCLTKSTQMAFELSCGSMFPILEKQIRQINWWHIFGQGPVTRCVSSQYQQHTPARKRTLLKQLEPTNTTMTLKPPLCSLTTQHRFVWCKNKCPEDNVGNNWTNKNKKGWMSEDRQLNSRTTSILTMLNWLVSYKHVDACCIVWRYIHWEDI